MRKTIVALLVAAVAFGAGAWLGRATKQDMVVTSSSSGASYGGGFKAGGDSAAAATGVIRSVAGPAPTNVVVCTNTSGPKSTQAPA